MSRIFISYKRADKEKVFPIIEEIKQETGVDCWIDYQGIESGDQFQNVIINAIDNSDIVIFMLSRNFIAPYKDEATGEVNHSRLTYPQKEVMYALNEGKRIVPISIDGTTVNDCKWLKFNCSGLDYIDWRDKDQQNKFMNNLLRWCGTKEDDLDERREANYQNNVSQLAPWYKCPKVKLYGMRGAIIVALMCVSALLYALFSPARLYIDAPGLSSAQPASSVAPLHKESHTSYTDKNPYAWLSQREVCAADLRGLSGSELRIMRNAIYARHGYIFQSADLSRFFSQFSWYEPRYSNVESLLSSIEKHNVKEIRSWE